MKAAFLAFEESALWQVALLFVVLRKQNWDIQTLTLGKNPVISDGGLRILPDESIERASPWNFDFIVLAGGDIPLDVAEDTRIHRFLRQFDGRRGWIAASCASTVCLAAAGLLGGLKFTAMPDTIREYEGYFRHAIFTDQDVCIDGNIVTCKGYAHVEWLLCISQVLGFYSDDLKTNIQKLARNQSGSS